VSEEKDEREKEREKLENMKLSGTRASVLQ